MNKPISSNQIGLFPPIHLWPTPFKRLLSLYLLMQTIGLLCGLLLVGLISQNNISGLQEHYRGQIQTDPLEIPDSTPKPLKSMLITTHTHMMPLALLFFVMGVLILHVSVNIPFKNILAFEPIIALGTTFGGLWLMRYVHSYFIILVLISSVLLYGSYFIQVGLLMYELIFIKPQSTKN